MSKYIFISVALVPNADFVRDPGSAVMYVSLVFVVVFKAIKMEKINDVSHKWYRACRLLSRPAHAINAHYRAQYKKRSGCTQISAGDGSCDVSKNQSGKHGTTTNQTASVHDPLP
ncbi:hypothetical protein [Enterobacter sp. MGH 14]|uniref:hypothetical protein n=1 Tax=Enterobacter sp. MGH 14 TaxID=1329823 RepID=UPI002101A46C|nr:hypothetical protein [Enterobacter sp. MGH 14]